MNHHDPLHAVYLTPDHCGFISLIPSQSLVWHKTESVGRRAGAGLTGRVAPASVYSGRLICLGNANTHAEEILRHQSPAALYLWWFVVEKRLGSTPR